MAKKDAPKAPADPDPLKPKAAAKVKADPNGDIDQRMQALLEDHQAMGVRPK